MKEEKLEIIEKEHELFGKVRFTIIGEKEYAVGKDIAKALGYADESSAISKKCKNGIKSMVEAPCQNKKRVKTQVTFVSEHDILALISQARTKSTEYKQQFKDWLVLEGVIEDKIVIDSREEIDFLDKLDQALKPFNIQGERQYLVKNKKGTNYRIDYYIESLNIAIEYDENNHSGYTYEQHEGRQEEIENILGCKFIRVTDKESDEFNIGLVIKQMFNLNINNRIKKKGDWG